MPAINVKFFLATEADDTSTSTTVINVKGVQRIDDNEVYLFPKEKQKLQSHTKLAELGPIKSIKTTLSKRNLTRTVRILLDEDTAKIYVDEHGNFKYKDDYLEAGKIKYTRDDNPREEDKTHTIEVKKRNLHSIQKEMILDKFNGKNFNAMTWLKLFEEECLRIEVENDQFPEVLRLVLEGFPAEWYQATKKTIGNGLWSSWRREFRLAFGTKGWNEIADSINFKYLGGSLVEYAFRKHNLLLDSDPELSERSRIGLMVIGLPNWVQSRLNRGELDTVGALTSQLNQLESGRREPRKLWERKENAGNSLFFNKNNASNNNSGRSNLRNRNYGSSYNNNNNNNNNSENRNRKFEPCGFCRKMGRENMFHPEKTCWHNPNGENYLKSNESYRKTGQVRVANNTLFERQLNEEENLKKN
jgi:hypothetical protein